MYHRWHGAPTLSCFNCRIHNLMTKSDVSTMTYNVQQYDQNIATCYKNYSINERLTLISLFSLDIKGLNFFTRMYYNWRVDTQPSSSRETLDLGDVKSTVSLNCRIPRQRIQQIVMMHSTNVLSRDKLPSGGIKIPHEARHGYLCPRNVTHTSAYA